MEPLHVTARLLTAIALPGGPLALDALLAAAVCRRDDIPPPPPVRPIEIPVEREPGGRFHLATFSLGAAARYDHRWVNRRFPIEIAQTPLGSLRIRRVHISGGPAKSYRIPLETIHLEARRLDWYAVGERREIEELLAISRYIGKRRAVGLGRVERWEVEPCEPWPGFPLVRDGRALRPLPPDWPGLVEPVMEYRTISYPYWDATARVLCAVPEGVC